MVFLSQLNRNFWLLFWFGALTNSDLLINSASGCVGLWNNVLFLLRWNILLNLSIQSFKKVFTPEYTTEFSRCSRATPLTFYFYSFDLIENYLKTFILNYLYVALSEKGMLYSHGEV